MLEQLSGVMDQLVEALTSLGLPMDEIGTFLNDIIAQITTAIGSIIGG